MRERKNLLSAWLILEIGKSWVEADGDVAESIDFCEYYGRQVLALANPAPLVPKLQVSATNSNTFRLASVW